MKRSKFGIVLVAVCTLGLTSLFSWLYYMLFANAFLSTLAGFVSYMLMLWLFTKFNRRFDPSHRDGDLHDKIINAIQEVARGNFNVVLDVDDIDPHDEMIAAFNQMASDLGNLETMRQDFISDVSHEIQSPLTSIKGFAALLKDDSLSSSDRQHYAAIIESESRRLSALSDNLLKLSALDKSPLNKTEFRLDKQIEQVVLMLEPQWKDMDVDFDLEKTTIVADEDLLSQVWINLLGNAIKFTRDRIQITLKAGTVTISDNGAGIADTDMVHIFERFYKADKARDRSLGGNGLGLSIVKKIVDMHGGSVQAQSEIGAGTRFSVVIPKE